MEKVNANGYPVYVGDQSLEKLRQILEDDFAERQKIVLVDEHTKQCCLPILLELAPPLSNAMIIEVVNGEENKSVATCKKIWEQLFLHKVDRSALLINLGGGVICDMGGFVASTYKRGIAFMHVPTTFLAQVDASIGGKVGVNLQGVKNQVGLFSNPLAVFVDEQFLDTLPQRQIYSGLAEVYGKALIADEKFWHDLTALNTDLDVLPFQELTLRSIQIKNSIVNNDPKEIDVRKVLNFGHTIGHALEKFASENNSKGLLHGEAVVIGMICEAYLSYKVNGLPLSELEKVSSSVIKQFNPRFSLAHQPAALIELMRHDKKNFNGQIMFTLLESIGTASINLPISEDLIEESLHYYQSKVVTE